MYPASDGSGTPNSADCLDPYWLFFSTTSQRFWLFLSIQSFEPCFKRAADEVPSLSKSSNLAGVNWLIIISTMLPSTGFCAVLSTSTVICFSVVVDTLKNPVRFLIPVIPIISPWEKLWRRLIVIVARSWSFSTFNTTNDGNMLYLKTVQDALSKVIQIWSLSTISLILMFNISLTFLTTKSTWFNLT